MHAGQVVAGRGRAQDVEGGFDADAAVEIVDERGAVFAKGLRALLRRRSCDAVAGRRTADLPEGLPHEVVHRDDLVVVLARRMAETPDLTERSRGTLTG